METLVNRMETNVEPELAALAASGATALVGAMVSDAWAQAKAKMAALLGRGGSAAPASIAGELEESRSELEGAYACGDQVAAADIEAMWRLRLRRLLHDDPAAANALRRLINEVVPTEGQGSAVHNAISGGTQYGPVVQGRNFSGPITLSTPVPPPERPDLNRPGFGRDLRFWL